MLEKSLIYTRLQLNQNLSLQLRQIVVEQYFLPGYVQLHDLFCFAGETDLFQMAALNVIFHAVLTDCNYQHCCCKQRRWKLSMSL